MIWLAVFVLSMVMSVLLLASTRTLDQVKAMTGVQVRSYVFGISLFITGLVWAVATIVSEVSK